MERRLIADAARFGDTYQSIRTWDDYLSASLVACATGKEVKQKTRATERLIALLEKGPESSDAAE